MPGSNSNFNKNFDIRCCLYLRTIGIGVLKIGTPLVCFVYRIHVFKHKYI